jgi:hypothetical protein
MGGLTEVWLWHPEGVLFNNGFSEVNNSIKAFINESNVTMFRGDEVATWRANRERFTVNPEWDSHGQLKSLHLSVPRPVPLSLPVESNSACSTISYWIIGDGSIPGGWTSSRWSDPYGRTITRFSHKIAIHQ